MGLLDRRWSDIALGWVSPAGAIVPRAGACVVTNQHATWGARRRSTRKPGDPAIIEERSKERIIAFRKSSETKKLRLLSGEFMGTRDCGSVSPGTADLDIISSIARFVTI
jgi:hypothetical protein